MLIMDIFTWEPARAEEIMKLRGAEKIKNPYWKHPELLVEKKELIQPL